MTARAEAAAATADRILDAAVELYYERPSDQIGLDDVARRAGVAPQTVIRRFGGKQGVLTAAAERESARVRAQRDQAPAGDVDAAVRVLVDHYEELGDRVMRLLADEQRDPAIASILEHGRRAHVEWCERVFAPALRPLRGARRERRLAQVVAACDVYTWKLLRRDRGLSRRQTETAIAELAKGVL